MRYELHFEVELELSVEIKILEQAKTEKTKPDKAKTDKAKSKTDKEKVFVLCVKLRIKNHGRPLQFQNENHENLSNDEYRGKPLQLKLKKEEKPLQFQNQLNHEKLLNDET